MKRSLQFFVHQRYRSLNPSATFKLIRKVLQLDAIIYCLSVYNRELEIDYWNVSLSLCCRGNIGKKNYSEIRQMERKWNGTKITSVANCFGAIIKHSKEIDKQRREEKKNTEITKQKRKKASVSKAVEWEWKCGLLLIPTLIAFAIIVYDYFLARHKHTHTFFASFRFVLFS